MSTPKTALIIGASRGLGLGLVKQLLQDGWEAVSYTHLTLPTNREV